MSAHAAPADSPYRLRIADPDAYRLAPPYRAPEKNNPGEDPATDPVVGALSEAAQAEAAARREAEMAAKPHARQIERAARAAQLDPALVHALIYVESRHSAKAVSVKGAVGLMQVLPDTGARYGIDPTRTTESNLKAGTRYLRYLMQRFDDRLDLVLAAYNAGEGAVTRYANKVPPYPETRDYVRSVLAKYSEWKGPAGAIRAKPLPAGAPAPDAAMPAPVIKTVPASEPEAPRITRLESVTLPAAPSANGAPLVTLAQLQH
jgi:soluble lytic murein transglycosylase-like protein